MSSDISDPRFRQGEVDSALWRGNGGESFRQFVYEALKPKISGLKMLGLGAQDDCIDLLAEESGRPTAYECKRVSGDDWQEILKRWRNTMSSWATHVPSPCSWSRPSWWHDQVDLPVAVSPNMKTPYVLSLPVALSRAPWTPSQPGAIFHGVRAVFVPP